MILRLEPPDHGRVLFEGKDIYHLNPMESRRFCADVQMVPQHPDAAFNPRLKLGSSLREVFRFHRICAPQEQTPHLEAALAHVSIHPDLLMRYPSQLSGGEIQRLAIARAILTKPSLLVLDEVTSMLDVSVQAAVVRTLEALYLRHPVTYLFITHNMALAKVFCHAIYRLEKGRLAQVM
jgi:ABC-type glutathione transport system ATPase component